MSPTPSLALATSSSRPNAPSPPIAISTRRLARISSGVLGCLMLWGTIVSLGVLASGSLWISANLGRLHRRTRSSAVDFCTCEGGCPGNITFAVGDAVQIKKTLVCCPDC